MKSLFDFNSQAETYEDYYLTEQGKAIDKSEKDCVKSFLDEFPKTNILELGCGTGYWSKWFVELGFSVYGIDIADKMLQKARSKELQNCEFVNMSMTELEFEDNSIENIIAITSLEFSSDLDETFSEIKRVLKPNGNFVAAVLNSNSVIGLNKKNNPTFANANFFSMDSLKSRLSEFGNPQFCKAAFLNEKFDIDIEENCEPAMLVGYVKNVKI